MESPKKQIPPYWDEIVRRSREESPPAIDVRPQVRARIETELRSPSVAKPDAAIALLDGIFDLFAKPFARLTLGACFGLAAILAIVSTTNVEVSELTGNEIEVVENFDEVLVGLDWTEYL